MTLHLTLRFDGHSVRMTGTPEHPEWVARDVCRVLHLHNASMAVTNAGVEGAEKGISRVDTPGGPQDLLTVTEPGLWKLVMASRKPAAQRFRTWLASEVIPSIRQHGCFPPPAAGGPVVNLRDPLQLARITAQALELVAELQPKAEAWERVVASDGDVNLQNAGRLLGRQPNHFIDQLEKDGVLFRTTHRKLAPASRWREAGYFLVKLKAVDGENYLQTLVTPRGLEWLAGRYPATDLTGAGPSRPGRLPEAVDHDAD